LVILSQYATRSFRAMFTMQLWRFCHFLIAINYFKLFISSNLPQELTFIIGLLEFFDQSKFLLAIFNYC